MRPHYADGGREEDAIVVAGEGADAEATNYADGCMAVGTLARAHHGSRKRETLARAYTVAARGEEREGGGGSGLWCGRHKGRQTRRQERTAEANVVTKTKQEVVAGLPVVARTAGCWAVRIVGPKLGQAAGWKEMVEGWMGGAGSAVRERSSCIAEGI